MKAYYRLFAVMALITASSVMMFPAPALAQGTDVGTIDGRVLDESRAAVPGATVTARNTASGITRTAASSATGTYHIGALPAGNYEITAQLTGFATQIQKNVPVQVASVTTVDFAMKGPGAPR